MCYDCKHFHGLGRRICDAFRDGIPGNIFWGGKPHDKHYPGDHGIQFEEQSDHSEVRPDSSWADSGQSGQSINNRHEKQVADRSLNMSGLKSKPLESLELVWRFNIHPARLLEKICQNWNVHNAKKHWMRLSESLRSGADMTKNLMII